MPLEDGGREERGRGEENEPAWRVAQLFPGMVPSAASPQCAVTDTSLAAFCGALHSCAAILETLDLSWCDQLTEEVEPECSR